MPESHKDHIVGSMFEWDCVTSLPATPAAVAPTAILDNVAPTRPAPSAARESARRFRSRDEA